MAAAGSVANEAFVTLATNDTYSLGASVLANSLRRVGTTRKLVIMITAGVSQGMRQQLSTVFDLVTQVNVLDSQDSANLTLLTRPDLGVTFTKLHCWRLTQFTKCVFLDADTLVLQNCDELFEREELSAAPDPGWPDCFNSGVFVYKPSEETYKSLLEFAVSTGSFDGGDQGLLNLYFSDWATKDIKKHLPFIYNVVSQSFYSYLPAFRQFGKNVKIVHFIGALKPWHAAFNTATGKVESHTQTYHHQDYLQLWWNVFMEKVNPALNPEMLTNIERVIDEAGNFQTHLVRLVHGPPQNLHIPAKARPLTNQHSAPSHMTSPYQPPDFPIFYDPVPSSPGEQSENQASPVLIEMPSSDRLYAHFESFYSELPMADNEEYVNVEEVYFCREQHVILEKYCQSDENYSEQQEESVENNNCTSPTGTVEISEDENYNSAVSRNDYNNDLNCNTSCVVHSTDVRSCGKIVANERELKIDQSEDSTSDDHQEFRMGLVGELASLRLEGALPYTPEQLQDRQRQYAWERGQVDYLGMDSFQHIQKHIDDVVTGKVAIQKDEAEKSEKKTTETKKKGK